METLLIIVMAVWRRKDGSNKIDRWNISKAVWRLLLAAVIVPYCYFTFGMFGLWMAGVTLVNVFMGFKALTFGKGWNSWMMLLRYSVLGFAATLNPVYALFCAFAGALYPLGHRLGVPNYSIANEYAVGAIVLGGLFIIGG